MNNFDLTLNKVFTKRNRLNNPLAEPSELFAKFDETKTETDRTGNMYVGSAEQIHLQRLYAGFGINDGHCDRCGGVVMPWMQIGLCEKCVEEMEFKNNGEPEWLRSGSSFESPNQTPWFVV